MSNQKLTKDEDLFDWERFLDYVGDSIDPITAAEKVVYGSRGSADVDGERAGVEFSEFSDLCATAEGEFRGYENGDGFHRRQDVLFALKEVDAFIEESTYIKKDADLCGGWKDVSETIKRKIYISHD